MFHNFFSSENYAVYEIIWKNIVQPDRPQITIWLMRISRYEPKATNTHSQHVILIAFLRKQWLHEHAFHCTTYIACLLIFNTSRSVQIMFLEYATRGRQAAVALMVS